MSIVKSFSVGKGDMFYIYHNSDNFTLIDCCYDSSNKEKKINDFTEIQRRSTQRENQITRFISTHPDDDHIRGLSELDEKYMEIVNFYCVENETTKEDETTDFKKYCNLRDSSKAFFLHKGCKRHWFNLSDGERETSNLHCLWPDTNNEDFKKVLEDVKKGKNVNNISPILTYKMECGWSFMWMGDMEDDFRNKIKDEVNWPHVNVLFAPHHGRQSGFISSDILEKLDPDIIVIGEAPSENLNYYQGYNTITQNRAKDITFDCKYERIDIYVGNEHYEPQKDFLKKYEYLKNPKLGHYIGSFFWNN